MYMKRMFSVFLAIIALMICGIQCFADGEDISVDAKADFPDAEILMEASTGQVLYDDAGNMPLPSGTLNKLMTVLIAAEAIENGELTAETVVTAGVNAYNATGAVIWLESGDKITVDELLKGIIIGNANDACIALAEHICGTEEEFVSLMNTKAKEIGMRDTDFHNCTGYDSDGQHTTAYDMAVLARRLVSYDFLIPYMTTYMTDIKNGETQLVNTNRLVREYKGALGLKAGYSEKSGHCIVAAAERDGVKYIAVTLGNGDKDNAFTRAKSLLNTGFTGYESVVPQLTAECPKTIRVKGGIGRELYISCNEIDRVIIPVGKAEEITTTVVVPETVNAPVNQGEIIGEVIFFLGEEELCRTDVVAMQKIEKMTFFKALCILLKSAISF
ncbi:MAG: D-alanyl-D-alanine carboxypeptidase [Ruminococcus sp.]|nr:D-alanyl-D-alanine carboxypeptidase [Ruminococcus sp.]